MGLQQNFQGLVSPQITTQNANAQQLQALSLLLQQNPSLGSYLSGQLPPQPSLDTASAMALLQQQAGHQVSNQAVQQWQDLMGGKNSEFPTSQQQYRDPSQGYNLHAMGRYVELFCMCVVSCSFNSSGSSTQGGKSMGNVRPAVGSRGDATNQTGSGASKVRFSPY